ncbi:DUF5694 domain-containing protein [Altererythrobacter lutimaris]|uniref:TraB/GumN family protein n=1 Tax=Altererythrobacter lutimaris TaxID=2743979 RepID=A0A850HBK5_9SPHN|nr:DUF5694 domain-containing protein [Altererythrobacter lutimaris]NVE94645.1 hypothetical protein [Altererythrobacter lutimaris]
MTFSKNFASLASFGALILSAITTPLHAQSSDDASEIAGGKTRVLVLGTPHLAGNDEIGTDDLAPLLDRLENFAPETIAIEAVPGQTCELIRVHAPIYPGVADRYCPDPAAAREFLGFDAGSAEVSLVGTLMELPANESPDTATRRKLAGLFLATGDPWSAAMHWGQLAPDNRGEGEDISAEMKAQLDTRLTSKNENLSIAGALGNRLGHSRLYLMDDHSADAIMIFGDPEIGSVLQGIWGRASEEALAFKSQSDALLTEEGQILAYYRLINSEPYQAMTKSVDFGAAARSSEADNAARTYVAWWHARNLKMAANIVEAFGNKPGSNVLVITGASHKAYLDQILVLFETVELVDVDDILAE